MIDQIIQECDAMTIYADFARFYASGEYPGYSMRIADRIPELLAEWGGPAGGRLLDLACGTGAFALEMAARGWQVSGLDQSEQMLDFARAMAVERQLKADFARGDMRSFEFTEPFDLVTCWFDSLNYLLSEEDLFQAFLHARKTLKPGGWFVFDMNTICGLMSGWMREKAYIQSETEHYLELHRPVFDYEANIVTLRITIFEKEGDLYRRYDEAHSERGYALAVIQDGLEKAGFEIMQMLGSLKDLTPPRAETQRVWIAAQAV